MRGHRQILEISCMKINVSLLTEGRAWNPKAQLAPKPCFVSYLNAIFHAKTNLKAKWQCFEDRSSREYGEGNFRSWSNRRDLIHCSSCWIWFSCAAIFFWTLLCFEAWNENSESSTLLWLMVEDSAIMLGIHISKMYHFKVPPHCSYQIAFHF